MDRSTSCFPLLKLRCVFLGLISILLFNTLRTQIQLLSSDVSSSSVAASSSLPSHIIIANNSSKIDEPSQNSTNNDNEDNKNNEGSNKGNQTQQQEEQAQRLKQQQQQQTKNERSSNSSARPPFNSLVGRSANSSEIEIIGDVQFLLDFVVAGFPKTGTTSLLRCFENHTQEIRMLPKEDSTLQEKPSHVLARKLYHDLQKDGDPPGATYKRGYKSPRDIENLRSLRLLGLHWPKTKLIVGIRHPIPWFESFYNFRITQGNLDILHPSKIRHKVIRKSYSVSYGRSKFHWALKNLGKTNLTTVEERSLLASSKDDNKTFQGIQRHPSPVFLFDTQQLQQKQAQQYNSNTKQFIQDISAFLELKHPLSETATVVPRVKPALTEKDLNIDRRRRGITIEQQQQQMKERDSKKINICDAEYDEVRKTLLSISKDVSVWIRNYFLKSEDVHVSPNKTYFSKQIMMSYMKDPCLVDGK